MFKTLHASGFKFFDSERQRLKELVIVLLQ